MYSEKNVSVSSSGSFPSFSPPAPSSAVLVSPDVPASTGRGRGLGGLSALSSSVAARSPSGVSEVDLDLGGGGSVRLCRTSAKPREYSASPALYSLMGYVE